MEASGDPLKLPSLLILVARSLLLLLAVHDSLTHIDVLLPQVEILLLKLVPSLIRVVTSKALPINLIVEPLE